MQVTSSTKEGFTNHSGSERHRIDQDKNHYRKGNISKNKNSFISKCERDKNVR